MVRFHQDEADGLVGVVEFAGGIGAVYQSEAAAFSRTPRLRWDGTGRVGSSLPASRCQQASSMELRSDGGMNSMKRTRAEK